MNRFAVWKVTEFRYKHTTTWTIIYKSLQRERERDMRITNCYGEYCVHSPAKRFSHTHTQAHINMPSVKAERSQSPNCALLKAQSMLKPHKQHADSGEKKVPTDTAPHAGSARFAFLPVAPVSSECWAHPWYRAPTYHASLPVHSHAALARLLHPPSLGLNLILAAAKHFHQNLSDWRGAVTWHLLLFLSSPTSGVKEREQEKGKGRERAREKTGSSNLA